MEDYKREQKTRAGVVVWWIALGSGIGGGVRIAIASVALDFFGAGFPYGILAINIFGSFAIGMVAELTAVGGRWVVSPAVRQGLMAGFCGGFTTFSFFSLQTFQLLQYERWLAALAYVSTTVVLSLLAVWLGYRAGRGFQSGTSARPMV